ncbi:hypothetical protein BKA62DRAFT_510628 [Auriculariales sp. MPI-PUGE-AT-0066]|nr:hypothetical protein BKA62DRAFT_510628 [Auriculariales sp. MPI-PUGE-AT-0066]
MLADTDIAPEGHDYSVERDIAGAVNKAYQYLDGHLSPLLSDAAVKRILDATRAALSARATRHNQMAAINRLPPSLFITIAEFMKPMQLVDMSFVCSAWYTTLVNAPAVWTDIDGPSFPGVQKRTKMVTEFLRRSQQAPVDLKLSITQARDPGIQAIVFNQLGSIRRLHLINPSTDPILGRDWMRIMQRPTRSLELLELASTSVSTSASGKRVGLSPDVFNGEAPRLRTLALHLAVFDFNLNIRYSAFQGLENLDLGCLPARIGAFTPAMLGVLLRNYPRLLHISILAGSWNTSESPIEPVRCILQRLELNLYEYSTVSSTLSKADAVRVMSAVVQAPQLQVIVSFPGIDVINDILNREQHGIVRASAFGTYSRSCAQLRHQDGRVWLFYDSSNAKFPLPPRHKVECFGLGRRETRRMRFHRSQISSPSRYMCFHAPATTSCSGSRASSSFQMTLLWPLR